MALDGDVSSLFRCRWATSRHTTALRAIVVVGMLTVTTVSASVANAVSTPAQHDLQVLQDAMESEGEDDRCHLVQRCAGSMSDDIESVCSVGTNSTAADTDFSSLHPAPFSRATSYGHLELQPRVRAKAWGSGLVKRWASYGDHLNSLQDKMHTVEQGMQSLSLTSAPATSTLGSSSNILPPLLLFKRVPASSSTHLSGVSSCPDMLRTFGGVPEDGSSDDKTEVEVYSDSAVLGGSLLAPRLLHDQKKNQHHDDDFDGEPIMETRDDDVESGGVPRFTAQSHVNDDEQYCSPGSSASRKPSKSSVIACTPEKVPLLRDAEELRLACHRNASSRADRSKSSSSVNQNKNSPKPKISLATAAAVGLAAGCQGRLFIPPPSTRIGGPSGTKQNTRLRESKMKKSRQASAGATTGTVAAGKQGMKKNLNKSHNMMALYLSDTTRKNRPRTITQFIRHKPARRRAQHLMREKDVKRCSISSDMSVIVKAKSRLLASRLVREMISLLAAYGSTNIVNACLVRLLGDIDGLASSAAAGTRAASSQSMGARAADNAEQDAVIQDMDENLEDIDFEKNSATAPFSSRPTKLSQASATGAGTPSSRGNKGLVESTKSKDNVANGKDVNNANKMTSSKDGKIVEDEDLRGHAQQEQTADDMDPSSSSFARDTLTKTGSESKADVASAAVHQQLKMFDPITRAPANAASPSTMQRLPASEIAQRDAQEITDVAKSLSSSSPPELDVVAASFSGEEAQVHEYEQLHEKYRGLLDEVARQQLQLANEALLAEDTARDVNAALPDALSGSAFSRILETTNADGSLQSFGSDAGIELFFMKVLKPFLVTLATFMPGGLLPVQLEEKVETFTGGVALYLAQAVTPLVADLEQNVPDDEIKTMTDSELLQEDHQHLLEQVSLLLSDHGGVDQLAVSPVTQVKAAAGILLLAAVAGIIEVLVVEALKIPFSVVEQYEGRLLRFLVRCRRRMLVAGTGANDEEQHDGRVDTTVAVQSPEKMSGAISTGPSAEAEANGIATSINGAGGTNSAASDVPRANMSMEASRTGDKRGKRRIL